jgi:predicted Rossmann fold flavoprotein
VVAALLRALAESGATLAAGVRAVSLARVEVPDGERFEIATATGASILARNVILATGGQSLPKTGSDGWGYGAAYHLGHGVLRRYPALVPLLSAGRRWGELAGVSLVARVSAVRGERVLESRTGDLLFTHAGFSGPVVLDQSHWLTGPEREGVALVAAWHGLEPEDWEARLLDGGARTVAGLLRELLPRRLVGVLLELAGVHPERKLSELTREERKRLVRVLGRCPLETTGDEGYRVAEVTGGGVPLSEVSTRTLESRLAPGLYFCGEVLDVTGRIGGYNFLWAWVSGRRAGEAVAAAEAARAAAG